MSGQFAFILGKQDFISAYFLHLRRIWLWKRITIAVFAITAAYAGLIIGVESAENGFDAQEIGRQLGLAFAYGIGVVSILVCVTIVGLRLRLGRMFDQLGIADRETTFRFDGEGLQTANREATTTNAWSRFRNRIEDDRFILLLLADNVFIVVVKALIDPEMLARFTGVLDQSGLVEKRS